MEKITGAQKMINCLVGYYNLRHRWPENTQIARELKMTMTGVKALLRTLAAGGAVEINENVEVIGSIAVRKNWATISILSKAS